MIERRTIRFEHEPLVGLEHPCFVASGAKDGPRLVLLGGIHGCEYSSIAAVIRSRESGNATPRIARSTCSFGGSTAGVPPESIKMR